MRVHIEFSDGRRAQRLAASTVAVGYVADVVALGCRRFAALGGLAYTAAALLTCARPRELRLGDGTTLMPRRLTNLVINNTAHLANFRAFHDARLDDGRLDVLEASYGWGRQMLHNAAILAGSRRSGRRHCGRRAWWPSTTCGPRVSWWTGSCWRRSRA